MRPETWTRARALFERALDLDAVEREGWARRECGADETLAAAVLGLLRADSAVEVPLLDHGASPWVRGDDLTGVTVAGFQVLRRIGEGGMGTVWEARQQRPQRTVALKTLGLRFESERAHRRFEDEAEILARLRHPGVAQVIDAGSAHIGGRDVPWFAMELVEGPRPIDRYVREHDLDARSIATLFAAVCDAVQYAHQRGVIHRDLKPANVLVDLHGQPKVIDFGIARLAERSTMSRNTRTGEVLGTLAYMSPERLEHRDAGDDTASDVYALGVVLYELLAGRSPFDLADQAPARAVDVLRTSEPVPPSRVRAGVPVELDWVTMRAMARERSRRYATARELAQDLERFMRNEPVLASPPSATYRLRKLAWRHRLLLGAAAVAFVAVSIGLVVAASGWRRVAVAESQATQRAATLAEVNRFQERILRGAYGSVAGRHTLLADVVDAAVADLDRQPFADAMVEIGARNAIGASYLGLGRLEDAERQLRRALALIAEHGVAAPSRLDLAVAGNLASCYTRLGKLDLAEEQQRAVLADRILVHGPQHVEVAVCRSNLAATLNQRGAFAEALELATLALHTFESWKETSEHAINARAAIAKALMETGRTADAERELDRALATAAENLHPDHPARLAVVSLHAGLLHRAGRFDEFLRVSADLADARERVSGPTHPSTLIAWNNLATAQAEQGRHAAAEATLRKVVAAQAALGIRSGFDFLATAQNLTVAVRRQGRTAEAERLARAARESAAQSLPDTHWLVGVVVKEHGGCLRELGRFDEAEDALLDAHQRLVRATSAGDFRTQRVVTELIALYDAWQRPADAEHWRAEQTTKQ